MQEKKEWMHFSQAHVTKKAQEFIVVLFLDKNRTKQMNCSQASIIAYGAVVCHCKTLVNKWLRCFLVSAEQIPSEAQSHCLKLHSLFWVTRKTASVHKLCASLLTKEKLHAPFILTKRRFHSLDALLLIFLLLQNGMCVNATESLCSN